MLVTSNNNQSGYSEINGIKYNHSNIYIPIANFAPGYYVEAYLDVLGNVVKYHIVRDLIQPENYGLVTSVESGNSIELPRIKIIDNSGTERIYSVKTDNSYIIETGGFDNTTYTINLPEGSVIKYNLQDSSTINKISNIELKSYNGSYNESSKLLVNANATINNSTLIYYKEGTQWSKVSIEKLDEFIIGNIIINANGDYVELLLLQDGLKSNYPNVIYGTVVRTAQILNVYKETVYKFEAFINGKHDYLYSSPVYTSSLSTIEANKGKLIRLDLTQDKVKAFSVIKPEIYFIPVVKVYDNNLIKIDSTFYEYSNSLLVYLAENTAEGYKITGTATKSDIKDGDLVQLYDLVGNYDGVIDTIVLIKK